MPIRKYLDSFIERKTHEAIHKLEETQQRLLSEMGQVDKWTLAKLRELLTTAKNPVTPSTIASYLKPLQDEVTSIAENIRHVTPEIYGAVGNGCADDTIPLQNALSMGVPVLLTGTYKVTKGLQATAPAIMGFNAAIIGHGTIDALLSLPPVSRVEGLILRGADTSNIACGIRSDSNSKLIFNNVTVRNLHSTTQATGIRVDGSGTISMKNIDVNGITALANGVVADGNGAAYGVVCKGYARCYIKDSFFTNIHSVDSSRNPVFEDSAAIYIQSFFPSSSAYIGGCVADNVGKYGYKTQAYNVSFERCHVFNNGDDFKDGFVLLPANGDHSPLVSLSRCRVVDDRNYKPENTAFAIENHVNICVENMGFSGVSIGGITNSPQSGNCSLYNCDFDGNGVVSFNSLKAHKCTFRGAHVLTEYKTAPNALLTECEFITQENTVPLNTYAPLDLACKAEFKSCNFSLHRYGAISAYEGANLTFNSCVFVFTRDTYSFIRVVNGSSFIFRGCVIDTSGASSYVIEANGNGEFTDNSTHGTNRVLRVTGGTLNTNLQPHLIVWESPESITHTPVNYETLPELPAFTPDNAYAVNLADGKLYKTQSRQWIVVNE